MFLSSFPKTENQNKPKPEKHKHMSDQTSDTSSYHGGDACDQANAPKAEPPKYPIVVINREDSDDPLIPDLIEVLRRRSLNVNVVTDLGEAGGMWNSFDKDARPFLIRPARELPGSRLMRPFAPLFNWTNEDRAGYAYGLFIDVRQAGRRKNFAMHAAEQVCAWLRAGLDPVTVDLPGGGNMLAYAWGPIPKPSKPNPFPSRDVKRRPGGHVGTW
jgi:hypothetical protein